MAQESWKREQEETACQQPEGPTLCVNNCGFFGSSTTMNMCSKCYRDAVLKQAKTSPMKIGDKGMASLNQMAGIDVAKESEKAVDVVAMMAVEAQAPATSASPVAVASQGDAQRDLTRPVQPNRCFSCKKRVGLTGFKCRCESVFCALHRHSDKHACTYDYKTAGRDAIAKANPIVKADKIDKI